MTKHAPREAEIEWVLRRFPGSSAREVVAELNRGRSQRLTKRDVNPILYSSTTFRNDGGYVPRWTVASAADTARSAARRHKTIEVRRSRDSLDRVQEIPLPTSPRHVAADLPGLDWGGEWAIAGLHEWQREALTEWFRAGGRGAVTAVTGTGKTHLGLDVMRRMAQQSGRTVVLVPTAELQRQWRRRIREHAPELVVAEIGGDALGSPEHADVTVALVQSARKRDLPAELDARLLVADEAHRYGSPKWAAALADGYQYRLGLTATLERSNDDGVDDILLPYFNREVFSYDYSRAVPERVVAPFDLLFLGVDLESDEWMEYEELSERIARTGGKLRAEGVFDGAGRSSHARIAALTGAPGALGRSARTYQSSVRKRRKLLADTRTKVAAVGRLAEIIDDSTGCVVFTQTIAAANDAARELRYHGVVAAAVHSELTADERRAGLDGLEDRSITALCAPKILDEGIDVPNVDLGIVLSASRDRRQMIQRLGRVIRRKPDGRSARFVVVYAANSVEDPALGSHEGFIDMVRNVARSDTVLDPGWDTDDVCDVFDARTAL